MGAPVFHLDLEARAKPSARNAARNIARNTAQSTAGTQLPSTPPPTTLSPATAAATAAAGAAGATATGATDGDGSWQTRAVTFGNRTVEMVQYHEELWLHRWRLMIEVVRRGVDVVHSDIDAVWLNDPTHTILNLKVRSNE